MLHWICRSDLETVMIAIFNDILRIKGSDDRSSSHEDIVNIFLNAANFSKHDEGGTEETMSFEDFRSWCTHLPSVRKLLGSLLLSPDSGIASLYFQHFCCWLNLLQVYLMSRWSPEWSDLKFHVYQTLPSTMIMIFLLQILLSWSQWDTWGSCVGKSTTNKLCLTFRGMGQQYYYAKLGCHY